MACHITGWTSNARRVGHTIDDGWMLTAIWKINIKSFVSIFYCNMHIQTNIGFLRYKFVFAKSL